MQSATHPDWSQLEPGFADPVHDAQRVFRALIDALARPGQLRSVGSHLSPSAEASVAARATLLALCDSTTPVWLQCHLPALASSLRFHTGAPLLDGTESLRQAQFALLTDPSQWPALEHFSLGTAVQPEYSTTLIIDVSAMDIGTQGDGLPLRLRGPGIQTHTDITVAGLSPAFWQARAALAPRFPAGLDLLLAANDTVLGIPRTTQVEVC